MLTAVLCASLIALAAEEPQASPPVPQVALISPTGGEALPQLEPAMVEALEQQGFAVTRLRLGPRDDSACADSMVEPACVERIVRRRTGPPLVVIGAVEPEPTGSRVRTLVLQRGEPEPVARFDARFVAGDLVLPIVFPVAVAEAAWHTLHPPAPPTAQEQAQLTTLDEPAAPPVEHPEPARPPARAPSRPGGSMVEVMSERSVDEALHLRRDFDQVCRRGPRRRRSSRDDPRDLRPRCALGPVLGYVRPRTWVTATLAIASGIASGLAFRASGGPYGEETRRKARAWGTATAATAAVLGVGVVTLTIGDRWQARRYLRDEQWLARW